MASMLIRVVDPMQRNIPLCKNRNITTSAAERTIIVKMHGYTFRRFEKCKPERKSNKPTAIRPRQCHGYLMAASRSPFMDNRLRGVGRIFFDGFIKVELI